MPRLRWCCLCVCVLFLSLGAATEAEDGYDLWLRYAPLPAERQARVPVGALLADSASSPTLTAARDELTRGLTALLGRQLPTVATPTDGALIAGTRASQPALRDLALPWSQLGDEGYVIRHVQLAGRRVLVLAANSDVGVLYGAFALLRRLQMQPLDDLGVVAAPRIALRLLNHWDNLDGSVERGYAGRSIWDWWRLPDVVDPRYSDYARANASVGINGTVLNNVNAQAEILTDRYLDKAAAIAAAMRPYGLRVFLAVRFSAPIDIGGLTTADPLDSSVQAWWQGRAKAIHARIPDFGGFLVKANSEGQPGPQDYGRSHVEGANLLAKVLQPYDGVVMWRAFVYSAEDSEDRVKQAYQEFTPLDGSFADNVLLQVKNGPLDFQPREPFHPLFGAMRHTPLMMEFQITQEYLGFASHLVYLGSLWEEVLAAETYADGAGSTVMRVIDGSLQGQTRSGIAGVANIGSDRDWTGAAFTQANWYAFGRLAWDPGLAAADVAREWLRMTFSSNEHFVNVATDIMMRSREAAVDYMTPLGLAHLMGTGHHYGPAPWVADLQRPEWNPFYYHRADAQGIGLDRGASGSNALAQYSDPIARQFADLDRIPERYLLWFHRLPWDYRVRSGATLWEDLLHHYDGGVAAVERMRADWATLEPYVDAPRFTRTARLLGVQLREARWWRDACIAYFQQRSGLPLPTGIRPPGQTLEYYQSLRFPYAPGN